MKILGSATACSLSWSSRATSQWVTHPGIALAPNSLNFRVPTTPKPVSSQKASSKFRVAQRTGPTPPSKILSSLGWADAPPQGFVPGPGYILTSAQKASPRSEWCSGLDPTLPSMILSSLGLATFSQARKDLFLGAHGATSQGVTHPGIALASNSLNFGVPLQPPTRLTLEFLRTRSQ
ncbi:hypothetical protein L3X38_022245 [Prunus dulcis]|uniref:Uncharacterized protein n=1 Tax=Prunus dulcis TaxID=3755 RepID=A0AAD4VYC9_PRUDU|nr:hypothetical protein L3X38_022245 [Prunus dulcis]